MSALLQPTSGLLVTQEESGRGLVSRGRKSWLLSARFQRPPQARIGDPDYNNFLWCAVPVDFSSDANSSARDAELAAIMDVVPALTFIAQDPECHRMISSRAAHELLRIPTSNSAAQDEPPSSFRVMRDGQELSSHEMPVQRAAKTGCEVRGVEFSLVFEDGTSHDLFGNAVPLLDDGGGVRGAVGAFIDITERKRVEQEAVAAKELAEKTLAQFRANIDSMSEGMYIVGTDGKRLLTNPAYFRIHGFDPGFSPDAISPLLERYDLNDKLISAEDLSFSRALRGEAVVQRQQRVRRIDTGTEVIVKVNATPVRDSSGEVIMAVVTVEDITAQKQFGGVADPQREASLGRSHGGNYRARDQQPAGGSDEPAVPH
jgi:PAS domain S-box-containing protein